MPQTALARFFTLLAEATPDQVFNPWTQSDVTTDAPQNGPVARRERLRSHLKTSPNQILIGEAAGYQGCHVSGIPFTSERLVISGEVPRVPGDGSRLSTRRLPWSEPSATIVWKTLHALGIATDTVLWNAYPWHPHRPGNPHSNRTPNRSERTQGLVVLEALLSIFPRAVIYAVGRQAEAALLACDRRCIALRHPSMGGATSFRRGLEVGIRYSRA